MPIISDPPHLKNPQRFSSADFLSSFITETFVSVSIPTATLYEMQGQVSQYIYLALSKLLYLYILLFIAKLIYI